MSKLIERLAKKIEKELGIKVDPESFSSIRPSHSYKLAGAWSWEMKVVGPSKKRRNQVIGSMWTATECVRKNVKLSIAEEHPAGWDYGIELVPEEKENEKE